VRHFKEIVYFKETPRLKKILQLKNNHKKIEIFNEIAKKYLLIDNLDFSLKTIFCY